MNVEIDGSQRQGWKRLGDESVWLREWVVVGFREILIRCQRGGTQRGMWGEVSDGLDDDPLQ